MSSFGYHFQHHPSTASSGNRSRRNPHRPSSTKSFQMMRPKEELTDIPAVPTFIEKFEAGRSFEMEDDFAFIPELCTEEERQMMDFSGSDRSSNSSGSPQSSPLQHQVQPSTAYPHAATYANMFNPNMHMKYQAPAALPPRQRNAIPIVNPNTGLRVASPPLASPSRMPHPTSNLARRVW
ncbi:hypothetical protein DFP73DRAFT_595511 [Morchella snyderi]|uniref:Uncharacterized protein n=1 Tax=Morchella conica CCBAS932 TaxID=1392247 RepID=A0A3N4KEL2_9PEZI|nr:hypothetical protein DFP73DRAFT_595511 [Morchella snyderi]RPB07799.1 hypothetical protein P167DRAFT_549492 [Morchella conica CCBAS932]